MSTLKTTNLQNPSAANPAIVLNTDGTATVKVANLNGGPISGARNRIINGDMRIDQRNAGASITPVDGQFSVDRWKCLRSQASKYSVQQNAGAVTPPGLFNYYLGATSLSAYASISTDYFGITQHIEGFNCADLVFGTASALTVTLSFWARSSLTGTFGGSLRNSANTRSYVFSYAINAANTWEFKQITIPGDTAGAWVTDSGTGITVWFDLGSGSDKTAAAGSWAATGSVRPTGSQSIVGTNGATFYLSGVQLEPGTVATPFERRSYGQELALCQRYYETMTLFMGGYNTAGSYLRSGRNFSVHKRATPTLTLATASESTNITSNTMTIDNASISGFRMLAQLNATGDGFVTQSLTASIEL